MGGVIYPLLHKSYEQIAYGQGIYLYDTKGNRYMDACSGAVTVNIGHGVKEIITAIKKQAEKVSFVYRSQFTTEPTEELANELATLAPGDINWAFFVNSGSEATETAMKIAIQYWQEQGQYRKQHIISRWMSYHGITLGALSMSGHPLRRNRFEPLLEKYPMLSPPYPNQALSTYTKEFEAAIGYIGPEHIAAFIAEPIIGAAGGAIVPPPGYYEAFRSICDKYQILFLADEVMTGMGRTGKMFAMEHWQTAPDVIAIGKGMSSGYAPIAATLVSDKIMSVITKGSGSIMSGHTFSGNPFSTATALAVIKYMKKHQLVEAAAEKGKWLMEQLQKLKESFPFILDVRGKGLLMGMEFSIANEKVIEKAFQKGMLLYPAASGKYGKEEKSIIVAPPLTITEAELETLITILAEVLDEIAKEELHGN